MAMERQALALLKGIPMAGANGDLDKAMAAFNTAIAWDNVAYCGALTKRDGLQGMFGPFKAIPLMDPPNNNEEIQMNKEIKTIRDARGKHYEIFRGPDNARRGEKEGILKYIDTLGSETHTDVSEWEIDEFLDAHGQIITDKRRINSLFFKIKSNVEKVKPKVKAKKVYVAAEKLTALSAKLKVNHALVIEQLEQTIKEYNDHVKERERNIIQYRRAIEDKKEEIEREKLKAKKAGDKTHVGAIRVILKEGNYTLAGRQPEGGIAFITKNIVKSFFSKDQATNLRVPMGKFHVKISLGRQGFCHAVKPWEDNIKVGNYWHPHLQAGEQLCFGEVRTKFLQAADKYDLKGVMDAIWDVLANFEDRANDGYMPLYRYEEEYKKQLKMKGATNGKEQKQKEIPV